MTHNEDGTSRPGRTCLVLEDQIVMRGWMCELLGQAFPDTQLVQQGCLSAAEAWLNDAIARGDPPWLAIIDIGLPDGSGIDFIELVARTSPDTRRVVATIYGDDGHLLRAIEAGADGYILKEEEPELIVATLKRIERDEPPLSPSIARRMLFHFRSAALQPEDPVGLTARETETLTLIARGLTVAETATQLGLKPQTVAGYVKIIYQKLNISSRAEATREAIRRGLA